MAKRAEAVTSLREDPDHKRETRERRRTIQARLESERDAEDRIILALGWANWEMAEAAAPAATRWMLGYRTRKDLQAFAGAARFAGQALDAAEKTVESLGKSTDNAVLRRRARWRETIETLRLFAATYKALAEAGLAVATAPANAQNACRKAALGLAELRENEDPDTAAAARLWQGVLLEAGSRSQRDLATLDLAMVPPERLPYDFFSRILRCQCLMANGSYALVVALTLRMEERCDRWFSEEARTAHHAKLTVIALRINCLWQWADALRATDPDEAAAIQERADALAAAQFPPGQATSVYRLDRAIPVYVELPSLQKRSAETRATPAATSRAASSPVRSASPKATSRESAISTSE